MKTVTALVRSIFQKESLDDCSLEELQAMARQYSYFTPVQFLLAEKLKTRDENLYKEQLQKLSLHFNNPLWLDYLLSACKAEDLNVPTTSGIPETVKEEVVESMKENGSPGTPVIIEEEQIPGSMIVNEAVTNSAVEPFEPIKDEIFGSAEKNEETTESVEQIDTDNEIGTPASFAEENNEVQMPVPPLPDLNQEPVETELTFQPYHTVDYFASQGIRFVSEEKPTDRFGKQLKSFTDWLKAMKRLPQTETSKITDTTSDKKVEQMAEHSIDESEVVTETMAEVWIKQGNKEKAIETYNKLSLLNPDKSAYFASLAEQLKNS
jgi:hypothetical protein